MFQPGTLVEARGQQWTLTRSTQYGDCSVVTLEGRDASNASARLRVIEPFEGIRAVTPPRPVRRSRWAALRAAQHAIALARPAGRLWTAAAAHIDLLAYQLEPALAVLAGSTRVLLADGVGLGKTIQAGLILSELREHGWIERALIVCPAGLRDGWARELHKRFQIDAAIFDQDSIAMRAASLPTDVNPWSAERVIITSIDFIKRAEVQAALSATPIELLIVDEAHHLAPSTDRGAAVSMLASRAPWCVLVSATPHSGDAGAFEYLTRIGSTDDRLTIFRRGRADVGRVTRRRSHVLAITSTPAETALLAAIHQYAQAIWTGRGRTNRGAQLVAITIERRAASSRAAIERSLSRRLDLLANTIERFNQPPLPWGDDDSSDDVEHDAVLGAAGFDDPAQECATLKALLAVVRGCTNSAKIDRIRRLLTRVREPAIIFTEYRDTLDALVDAFASSHRVGAIHGGLPTDLRRDVVDAFNGGSIDLLVATDTAGEGLNLHARCRLVINVDLPWNPMRLEQRAGRVDRLGQRRAVHVLHLCDRDSIEMRVLDQLRVKRHAAETALAPMSELDVAAAIFDGDTASRDEIAVITSDVVTSVLDEAERLERERRALRDGVQSRGLVWARPRRAGCRRYVILQRENRVNAAGVAIDQRLHVYGVSLAAMPSTDREWRSAIDRASRLCIPPHSDDATELGVASRIAFIRKSIMDGAVVLYQPSLFDGRSDAAAAARKHHAALLDAALASTLGRISARECASGVELIAAWPERRR